MNTYELYRNGRWYTGDKPCPVCKEKKDRSGKDNPCTECRNIIRAGLQATELKEPDNGRYIKIGLNKYSFTHWIYRDDEKNIVGKVNLPYDSSDHDYNSRKIRDILFNVLTYWHKGQRDNIVGTFSLDSYGDTWHWFTVDEVIAINLFQLLQSFAGYYKKGIENAKAEGKNLMIGLLNKDFFTDGTHAK